MVKQTTDRPNIVFESIDDIHEWEKLLAVFNAGNLYTSWGWGEYKKRFGWDVDRLVIKESSSNTPLGVFQLQKRNKFLFRLFLIQGGLHINGNETICTSVLNEFCRRYGTSKWRDIIVVNYYAEYDENYFRALLGANFTPVLTGSMYTFILDTSDVQSHYQSGLSGNWRHNLKRGQKNSDLIVRWPECRDNRLEALLRLDDMYSGLGARKRFSLPICVNRMKDIIAEDPNFIICEAIYNGEVVAVRVGYKCHSYILDFLAASNEGAKNNYANYLLIWALISKCGELGLSFFECGGIDPSGNTGVYNFKKGLGGRLFTLGPLWIYSQSRLLKLLARIGLPT